MLKLYPLLGLWLTALPALAQHELLPPEYRAMLTGHLPLPVAPATGRVAYRDSVAVAGVPARRILAAYYAFARRLLAPDYPRNPADTLNLPKPAAPAAPGEGVSTGSALIFDFDNPPPTYVAGITPPLDPRATYPSYPYVSFTVRLRVDSSYCRLTLTDLRVRLLPFDYPLRRMSLLGEPAAPPPRRPPGPPVEGPYARWLARPLRRPAAPPPAPPLPQATEAEARRLDFTMQGILNAFHRQMDELLPRPPQLPPAPGPGAPEPPATR